MKKLSSIILATGLLLGLGVVAGPATAATKFANCSELNKEYPTGVARTATAAKKVGTKFSMPVVNKVTFDKNKTLDKDKDLVVCLVAKPQTDSYTKKWGSFNEVTYSGIGDDVIELSKELTTGFANYAYLGDSNFIVVTYDKNMKMVDLLVNEIGSVSGSGAFGLSYFKATKSKYIEVTAEGDWSITLLPVSKAPKFVGSGSGSGVFKGVIKGGKKSISYDGESNFIMQQWCTNGKTDLLANEIGSYRGSKLVQSGTCLITVQSEGSWSFK